MKMKRRGRAIETLEEAWEGITEEVKRRTGVAKEIRAGAKAVGTWEEKERERRWSKVAFNRVYQEAKSSISYQVNSCHLVNCYEWQFKHSIDPSKIHFNVQEKR